VPVIHAGQDLHLHTGWGKEHLALPPIDVHLLGDPDAAVADLLAVLPEGSPRRAAPPASSPAAKKIESPVDGIAQGEIADALAVAVGDTPVTFSGLTRGWPVGRWPHRHPLEYLGKDGGGGVGSGPGLAIGAALALKDSGRLVVGVLGDGDCLMSINALWTAARYEIPVLFIVANNRSYFNDELHQESVARIRGRNPDNRGVGQRIDAPVPDIAKLAEAQGVLGLGPVSDTAELPEVMKRAVACVRSGRPCLIDVHIDPNHGRKMSESMAERSFAKPTGAKPAGAKPTGAKS
jgi:thiamine pyrophosphate-dependent acetolactate synthase large subunit-like protein